MNRKPTGSNAALAALFAVVFVDLLGFGLIVPLLPYYARTFGASDTLVGILLGSYAAAQFVGAPLLGRWSDRIGRRPVLLVSIAGNAVGFALLGLAGSTGMLFASRVLAGLTGGNIAVAQAYITDVTDAKGRARGLGMLGVAFGLGFVIGPATGGLLSQWGFAVPAFVAAGLATANLGLAAWLLPETLTPARRRALSARLRPHVTPAALLAALSRPVVGPLLVSRSAFMIAFVAFQMIFPLWALERLGADARTTSYLLAYIGVMIVLVQGVAIGALTARFSERVLLGAAVLLMTVALLGWAWAPSYTAILCILPAIALAGGTFTTVNISVLSKSVHPDEVGGTMGLSSAVDSLTRVIAPPLGAMVLERWGAAAPGLAGAGLLAVLAPYVWRTIAAPVRRPG